MNENLIDYDAQIWWWNGSTYDAKAFWYTDLYVPGSAEETLGYAGWGDEENWWPVSKTFAPGESFWIQVNDTVKVEDANYTMSGQIESVSDAEEYYSIPLIPNVQAQITHPFPIGEFSIQTIKMSENLIDYDAQIWWWNGATYDAKAFWYTDLYVPGSAEETLGHPGWGDEENWWPVEKTFNSDEGFWIQVNDTVAVKDAKVMFPNPFYKAPVK